jgi:predicted regulator of Ras-like GTPase activity (Roadblock/LC7/MglB family)
MAKMDGLELLESIHYLQPQAQVIMITAYGSDALEAEAKRLNAYRYLTKPLDLNNFRQVVQEAMGNANSSSNNNLALSDGQHRQIGHLLDQLRRDVSARCLFLTNVKGKIVARSGNVERMPLEEIASLLGGSTATINEAGQLLDGDQSTINLVYREGQHEYLYALNIGQQLLLILIIDRGRYSCRLGTVWYYAQQVAVTLRETLNQTKRPASPATSEDSLDREIELELDELFGADSLF